MSMKVYLAIAEVSAKLAQQGISKDRKNDQQGYKFRGIDDVYNALAPLLSAHKLCILPTVLERECVERTTAKGTVLFYVTVKVRFDIVSAEDGSKHEIVTFGEAMDSGDKATNKAMSAAYKYAAMQAFCIPTEGDNDADATTHADVQPKAIKSVHKPTDGAWEGLSPDLQIVVLDLSNRVRTLAGRGDLEGACDEVDETLADYEAKNDMKVALWAKLVDIPTVRNQMKKIWESRKQLETA